MGSLINIYCAIRLITHLYNRDGTTANSALGTAFVVFNPARTMNYLVTNRHVVDPAFKGDVGKSVDHMELRGHYQPTTTPGALPRAFHAVIGNPALTFHPDPTVDIAVIGSRDVKWLEGDSGTGLGAMSRLDLSMLPKTSELDTHLLPGVAVHTVGYPGIAGQVADRPILVQGIVSSDPRFPATIGSEVLDHSVLCHSFSWGGMSGAPVISPLGDLASTRLVGVNAGHISVDGTGAGVISHFIPSDRLVQMLAQSGDTDAALILQS